MTLFLSTVTNKVDAKGRISVPARFRAALEAAGGNGFACFPSFTLAALEGMTLSKAAEYAERIDREFNPFDDEGDAFAQSILASAFEVPIDGDGRVMLPDELIDHAGIEDYATFVGLGRRFQIWDPDTYQDYAAEARQTAREKRERFGTLGRRMGGEADAPETPHPRNPRGAPR